MALRRGDLRQKREALAKYLTVERDKLRDDLSARAREKGLDRTWPNSFFRVGDGRSRSGAEPAPAGGNAGVPAVGGGTTS